MAAQLGRDDFDVLGGNATQAINEGRVFRGKQYDNSMDDFLKQKPEKVADHLLYQFSDDDDDEAQSDEFAFNDAPVDFDTDFVNEEERDDSWDMYDVGVADGETLDEPDEDSAQKDSASAATSQQTHSQSQAPLSRRAQQRKQIRRSRQRAKQVFLIFFFLFFFF